MKKQSLHISLKISPQRVRQLLYNSTSLSIPMPHIIKYIATMFRKELPKVEGHQKDHPGESLTEAKNAIPDHSA